MHQYFLPTNKSFSDFFQIRGATNAVRKFQEKRCGADTAEGAAPVRVVTHSSGNHAQALALAAKRCGVLAEIVMPSNSPKIKVQAVEGYGGKVTFCHPSEQVNTPAALAEAGHVLG